LQVGPSACARPDSLPPPRANAAARNGYSNDDRGIDDDPVLF
jgi:hypothetical protein